MSLRLLSLLYPPRCPFCGELSPEGEICETCLPAIPFIEGLLPGPGRCEGLAAAFAYTGAGRQIILRYKQLGLRALDARLAAHVAVAVRRSFPELPFDGCIGVPSGRSSSRRRGFEASERLAAGVADLLGLPPLNLLEHVGRQPQKSLDRKARFENAWRSYRLREGAAIPRHARLLLVDDIKTTGATLSACAELLLDGGAESVCAAVAALD